MKKIFEDRDWQFWFFQFVGWSAYSLITFFSLTVWDDNVTFSHIYHIFIQAVLGVITSWPLRSIYGKAFSKKLFPRIIISIVSVIALSWIWTAARMQVFMWVAGDGNVSLWSEFNDWFFGSVFVFLSWTALYFGIKYYQLHELEHKMRLEEENHAKIEQMKRMRAEALAHDAQLQMLRYQLNPHFLFNTLNSINALVKFEENNKAQKMITQLSDFLRHTLDQNHIDNVKLKDEILAVNRYLDIEKTRFEDRLNLHFDIQQEALKCLVPSLILQPIYENSMKYAISQNEDGGSIVLVASVNKERLIIEISDSGVDDKKSATQHGRGVGLKNIDQRLAATYPENYSFDHRAIENNGFKVVINIPFQVDEK
jgi:two-component system LytT family sensor kinase